MLAVLMCYKYLEEREWGKREKKYCLSHLTLL